MTEWPPPDRREVYELPREPPAPPTEEQRRSALVRSRRNLGLPLSGAAIEELLGGDRSGAFTEVEQREWDRTRELIGPIRELLRDADDVRGPIEITHHEGRPVVRVFLARPRSTYETELTERFGDRVHVVPAELTELELRALQEQIGRDVGELSAAGVRMSSIGVRLGGQLHVSYFAPDQAAAEDVMHSRYGPNLVLDYQGASSRRLVPVPFASWLAEDDRLHVFHGLPHNGEQPGGAVAHESDHEVLVSLTIVGSRGFSHLVGGFVPSHATVQLSRPLGDRMVVDDSVNRVRPHWTQTTPFAHPHPL